MSKHCEALTDPVAATILTLALCNGPYFNLDLITEFPLNQLLLSCVGCQDSQVFRTNTVTVLVEQHMHNLCL